MAVLDLARGAVEHEHPRAVAPFGGALRDERVGEVEDVGGEGVGHRQR